MRLELKTNHWTASNWQQRTEKHLYLIGIITATNIMTGIYLNNYFIITFNLLTFISIILIILSYNKYRKEVTTK